MTFKYLLMASQTDEAVLFLEMSCCMLGAALKTPRVASQRGSKVKKGPTLLLRCSLNSVQDIQSRDPSRLELYRCCNHSRSYPITLGKIRLRWYSKRLALEGVFREPAASQGIFTGSATLGSSRYLLRSRCSRQEQYNIHTSNM